MSARTLTIGSRGSRLALRQADWVAAQLRQAGLKAAVRVIRTTGDQVADAPLEALGRQQGIQGVFTKEIEHALLAGAIDLAVHSLKDLPTELDPRLALGCVPRRADARDALVGKTLEGLRPGDRVGTGSPRRAAQLRHLAPGIRVVDLRGNVETRLRKLRDGACEAVVLAMAGLERLGLAGEVAEILDPAQMTPAVGQGALGLEVRRADRATAEALAPLHDEAAAAAVEAERALLKALGGGCAIPLGAHAAAAGDRLRLLATAPTAAGRLVRAERAGPPAEAAALGANVAAELRRLGVALGA